MRTEEMLTNEHRTKSAKAFGPSCNGCQKHHADVMVSFILFGETAIHDFFMDRDRARWLLQDLQFVLSEPALETPAPPTPTQSDAALVEALGEAAESMEDAAKMLRGDSVAGCRPYQADNLESAARRTRAALAAHRASQSTAKPDALSALQAVMQDLDTIGEPTAETEWVAREVLAANCAIQNRAKEVERG